MRKKNYLDFRELRVDQLLISPIAFVHRTLIILIALFINIFGFFAWRLERKRKLLTLGLSNLTDITHWYKNIYLYILYIYLTEIMYFRFEAFFAWKISTQNVFPLSLIYYENEVCRNNGIWNFTESTNVPLSKAQ